MKVKCQVCMHHCELKPGQSGRCRGRKNENGRIICSNYGQITSLALDPIEKKPLYKFYPGNSVLSVGSYGCNLSCPFCQNYTIAACSPKEADARYLTPKELAEMALTLKNRKNIGVAFTYNEPLIGYEYVRDTAKLLQSMEMKAVVVTNGSFSLFVLDEILPYVDAMNIDLKGFTQSYYKKLGGNLETVKNFIKKAAGACHVELTTLIVPGENDSREEMLQLAEWIASVDEKIPLHVTRFFPRWKMADKKATEISTVFALAEVARSRLQYVYTGNC